MSPLSPLTSCSPYLVNSMAAVASEPDQLQVLNILCTAGHISLPLLRSFIRINTSPRHVFIFRNYTIFTVRSRHHLDQPPTWTTTPYRLSPTTYSIYSQLPSILKAVPPSANWGRAMPRLQGPTYHISYLAAIFTIMLLAPQSTHTGDERASSLWFDVRTHWNWTPCEWEMWIFNLSLLFVSLYNLTAIQNSFHIRGPTETYKTVPVTAINKFRESTTIAFKVVPFWVDTQLQTMLPMFKAIPQFMFCKVLDYLRHFCFHTFCRHKMGSFEHWLDLWEQVEVAGSEIWRVGWLLKHSDVFSS